MAFFGNDSSRRIIQTPKAKRLGVEDFGTFGPHGQKIWLAACPSHKGLEVDNAFFTLFYQLSLASSGLEVKQKFESNEFSVSRQVRYSLANQREEIDMVVLSMACLLLRWNSKIFG